MTTVPSMSICIFDNDSTWRREVWSDGELSASFSAELVMALTNDDRRRIPFYEAMMLSRPWQPGSVVGDPSAKDVCA